MEESMVDLLKFSNLHGWLVLGSAARRTSPGGDRVGAPHGDGGGRKDEADRRSGER